MADDKLLIHMRFAPDGSVMEIGGRPAELTAQLWFNHLSFNAGAAFQGLSGGRGVFRLTRAELDALTQSAATPA